MRRLNISLNWRQFLLLAFTVLTVNLALAIDPSRAMSQYVHDRWGPGEGFPRGPVYAIAQTTDGYLWIGTQAGLVRFDGLQFVLMRDPSRIAGYSSVIGLSANPDGSLWIRTQDMKLLRYRDGTFSDPFKNQRQNSNLTAMSRSKGDELLTVRLQLGAFAFRGGGLSLLARATGVPRSPVLSIAMTGDDTYWLGTRGAGLFELKAGATKAITGGLPDSKINCLLPDRTGNLWIGTDNGIARWDGAEVTTRNLPAELTKSQILTMIRDRDSNLWLGTDSRGVLRFNAEGVSSLDSAEGETRNAVMALFEDREGDLWIGSANSIERLRYSPFVTYSAPEGLPTDGSNPIFTDAEDRTWFAPVSGGLWWMKNGVHGSIREAGLPNDIVYSVAGGKSELWVGRQRGGLTHLQRKGDGFTTVTYTKSDGLAQNSVYSVYLTRSGAIWAGTLSGGVSRLERETFTNYTIAQGLASNTVASMLESADGAMWFATPSGLSTFLNGLWHTYSTAQGLPSDNINCLLEDSAGILWAGTTAGLAFRASSEFAIPIHAPAAVREQVLGLAEDAFGFLWLATANHVLRVNRGKLLQGTLADGDLVEYGTADGLRGTEGVKRDPSVMRDSLGRIWISLNRGISVVDPARLAGRSAPAIPQIQTIAADGVAINITSSVRVPAGQQRIVISYAGLSLSIPERVRFRYRLEGFDRGWSETTTERQAVYTNLWPGTYSFRVLACNPSGVWSSQEAAITFSVEPAFWQRWWFSVAVVFACILAAVALYRSRLRQATARLHLRFEERLAERTRIARDLHDTLLHS